MTRAKRALLVVALAGALACETMVPSTILLGGAVLQVVAVNQFIDQPEYLTAVSGLIATMTSIALSAGENYLDYRARQQELARVEALEAEIASEYDALKAGEDAPAPSWEAAPESEGGPSWSDVDAPLPGQAAQAVADAQDAGGNPWGDRYPEGGQAIAPRGLPAAGPVVLDTAILKRVGERAVPIEDGGVLHDGIDDEVPADQLRVAFRPRADSFVYVVAVDAAGRVQPLHPSVFPPEGPPTKAGTEVMLPSADGWYGLDEYSGIQHVYFVAASERNADLEERLAWFAAQGIPDLEGQVHTVSEVTRVENDEAAEVRPRGLTGVRTEVKGGIPPAEPQGAPGGPAMGSPDRVITRHFVHR